MKTKSLSPLSRSWTCLVSKLEETQSSGRRDPVEIFPDLLHLSVRTLLKKWWRLLIFFSIPYYRRESHFFFYRLSSFMLTRLSLSRSLDLNSNYHFFFYHHVQRVSPRPLIFEDKTRTESKYLSLGSTSPEVPAPSKAPKSETLFPLGKAV